MTELPATRPDPYASLRIADFRWYILVLLAFTLASQMQAVVVSWQVYALTKDALSLGLIGLAEALPFIAAALYAGDVADRHDRRRVMMLSLLVLVGCAAALLAITLHPLAPRAQLLAFYGLIAASGLGRSFLQPARTALGAELVPREIYQNAVAWRSSTWQLAAVVGPAIGGLLYGFSGPVVAYVFDVALLVLAMGALWLVKGGARSREAAAGNVRERIASGLRFLKGQPIIVGALTLDLFSVFFGGATALLPIFADRILHVGPQGLGVLRAAPAVGAVAMSVVLTHRAPFQRAGRALLINVALFGLSMIAFGLSHSFALSLVLLVFSGMVDMVSVVIRSTLLQVLTPEALLGRVSAVNQIFIGSSNEIGAFESGVAARLFGVVPSVIFGGCMTIVVVGVTAWMVAPLRKMGSIAGAHTP